MIFLVMLFPPALLRCMTCKSGCLGAIFHLFLLLKPACGTFLLTVKNKATDIVAL